MAENIDIFDFQLSDEEVAMISSLNRNNQILPESKICPGI
jgi:diketogulonate reductase-like aldo/keto reductase